DLELKPGKRRKGDETTAEITQRLENITPPAVDPPEVEAQKAKIKDLQKRLNNHPLQQWGQPKELIKTFNRRQQLQEEVEQHHTNTRE
ncbi:MAG: hypothetical protein RI580_15960, partial [Halothece sp. Uz-M2-17]|nr:hypothetical protein [Halothece sp. Uz-M2-17]